MPRPGQRSITVSKEVAEMLDEFYEKYRKVLRRQGIFSKQQFIFFACRKYVEDLEKELSKG
jgi:c-di-AMP phosphodiesterase-like protein